MKIQTIILFLWLPLASGARAAETPWQSQLSLANHGYWTARAPVTIRNDGNSAAAGEPVSVTVPGFAGTSAEAIRVCGGAGQELMFEVLDSGGRVKHKGPLAESDRVVLPADCAAHSSGSVWIYAGNSAAWAEPDYLRFALLNGGFEAGSETPEHWEFGSTDETHHVSWEMTGGHTGARCVKVEVAAKAEPTWVQARQEGIPVVPGRHYEITAWVKTENVSGRAGWYLHVNGDKPQLINDMSGTDGGTRDWTQVHISFTAPATAISAIIGTMLHGTGRAWFDDVSMTESGGNSSLQATVGNVEHLQLETRPRGAQNYSADWPVCAVIRALNVTDRAVSAMVSADLHPTLGRSQKVPPGAELRLTDAATGQPITSFVRLDNSVLFSATLPPRSAREFYAYLNPAKKPAPATLLAGYEKLVNSAQNLAPNPSFEQGGPLPGGWKFTGGDPRKDSAAVQATGLFGQHSLEFSVPKGAAVSWTGWQTAELPVQPGALYFYSGFVKTKGVDGTAVLHAHLHTKEGKMVGTSAFNSTQPGMSGDSDWAQTSAYIQTPADAASIQLHLTMNAHGTLQHDGVLLCQVLPGEVVAVESADAAKKADGLQAWQVNPLIKVFPDDSAGAPARALAVECARNEYEPIQLAVRSGKTLKQTQVSVSALKNSRGDALPAVKIERVGYVPVDAPSSYYQTDVKDWERRLPRGSAMTDGWAGWWPDPLLPNAAFELAANQTQPLWFTVRAPAEAAPGDYRAEITLRAEGAKPVVILLSVKVLPFALPARTQLRTIMDFNFGPGGAYGSGTEDQAKLRQWLRFMADHRLGINHIKPEPVFSYQNGKVTMEATAFDEAAHFCLDELGMTVSYTPEFFYSFGWAYPPKKIFGLEPFTAEFNRAFKQAYQLFTDHVKAKGWHDKFVYYVSDEPHFEQPFVVEQMKKLCALIHEVDPAIPIYSSTWRHCPAWDNSLDLWGVGQYGCFPVPEIEALQKAGKHFMFTVDGQMAIDTPYLATERLLSYYCFKYGVTGFEFWGLAWWTYNPFETGWHTFISQSDEGKKYYWVRYPNGDGFLTYPGKPAGVEGPLSTIRFEQVREGLEDYEALTLLDGLVKKAQQAGRPAAAGERALAMARNLVTIPNAGGLHSSDILPDPDQVPEIRKTVNAAIVELLR